MSVFATNEGPVLSTKMNQKTLLVDTGANIAAATTYAGQLAFCTSTGSGFVTGSLYEMNAANAAWVLVAPLPGAGSPLITTYRQTQATQTTTSSSGVLSTNLQFTPTISIVYEIDAWLWVSAGTAADFSIGISAPTSSTANWMAQVFGNASAPLVETTTLQTSINTMVTFGLAQAGTTYLMLVHAVVHASSTAGTIGILFGSSNNSQTSTMYLDSFMRVIWNV